MIAAVCNQYAVDFWNHSLEVLGLCAVKIWPGRKLACGCQSGHCGGLGLSAGSEAGGPRTGIWSAAVDMWGSPPQSSGRKAYGSPAASPGAPIWPWPQSPSSCTPQNRSPWNAPRWHCTPGSNAPGCRRGAPVPQTAVAWMRGAGWRCTAEHLSAAAAQRSPGPATHAGGTLWWHFVLVHH